MVVSGSYSHAMLYTREHEIVSRVITQHTLSKQHERSYPIGGPAVQLGLSESVRAYSRMCKSLNWIPLFSSIPPYGYGLCKLSSTVATLRIPFTCPSVYAGTDLLLARSNVLLRELSIEVVADWVRSFRRNMLMNCWGWMYKEIDKQSTEWIIEWMNEWIGMKE